MKLRLYRLIQSFADLGLTILFRGSRPFSYLREWAAFRCTVENLRTCNERASRREILS